EIQTPEYGFGLDGALRARANVLTGIINGVDYAEWSPDNDPLLPANYSVEDLSGKQICKEHLIREFGLSPEAVELPLLGIVSRFTPQKGTDLVMEVAAEIVAEGACLVALCSGDPDYEGFFRWVAAEHPDGVAVHIGLDNRVA